MLISLCTVHIAWSQNSPNCVTYSDDDFLTGQAFFSYGGITGAFNQEQLRVNVTAGQPLIGSAINQQYTLAAGFWSTLLLPPTSPVVMASEGDLDDRIQINWNPDPLSPSAGSYKLYRNGALLATVDGETTSFIDFNVLAGRFYTYEVAGVNSFGEGPRGDALGFLNPNGSITGEVITFSGNPVKDAVVVLSPTFGAALEFDGNSMAFAEYQAHFPREEFTISTWVKLGDDNDGTAIFDFGSGLSQNWWLHTLPAASGKGVRFGIGNGPGHVTELEYAFPTATADIWHYIAVSYNGSSALLYVDGELIETAVTGIQSAVTTFFLGRKSDATGNYKGKLDELRFFNRQLPQTEIQMLMNQTASASTTGLVSYWKFDEGVGSKAFNIASYKTKLYLCGASWTSDKSPVSNAGITDETGFYKIEGVNYGAGATFTASASKNFYFNQSLEFNAVNENYADLTTVELSDSATVTMTVKAFDFSGKQALLSKADAGGTNQFTLGLNSGNLELTVGSTTEVLGPLEMGFHHLALVLRKSGGSLYVTCYKDGTELSSQTYSATGWDGQPWKIGARADGSTGHQAYFTGLVDEVAFFSELLSLSNIQTYANIGTSLTNPALRSYFNLNEGTLTALHDMGTALTGEGATHGAQWSTVAAITDILPHKFTPASRLVSLNPSNTSTDQVDFTDQSTIPVSGYVRFENTYCFQKKVEILVNGYSNFPPIITDEEGYFSADFEPGSSVVLTPKFEQHSFYPAFWELGNLSTPVAGILFRNQTKRKVVGQMAGGYCRKSVVPTGSIVKVKVSTLNGCYEQIKQLPQNGKFTFDGVPPDSVTVAVIEHSNNVIYDYFQLQGGATLDLKMQNDTADFIYFAPPNVELTPLPTNSCGDPMLTMLQKADVTIKVYEDYDGGRCYVDTALLTINNDIAHLNQFDTLMTAGSLKHKFRVEEPNITAPYKKYLQVTAKAHDEQATDALHAVVLGRRPRQTTFTSTSPDIPMLILHDPPGDGSSAFMESGETTCQNWSFSSSSSQDLSSKVTVSLGPEIETSAGTPFFSTALKVNVTANLGFDISSSTTAYSSNEMETCITTTKNISTGSGDVIVGSDQGGDVYMGGAMNFLYGITDELLYDSTICDYYLDKGLFVFPEGFSTTFIYSEYQILNSVIPSLNLIGDTASAGRWQDIVDRNVLNRKDAVFSKNISFDSGVTYSESETTETSQSSTTSWTQNFSAGFSAEFGVKVNGLGLVGGLAMEFGTEQSTSTTNTATKSRTVGYTLADDDVGDNFTVNIKKDRVYGTPVFDLISGQSSCPHEPNTQPRDGLDLTVDKQVAVNVPMNDAAVFKFNLGNTSQSEDWRYYSLALYNATNPDGAVVKVQGTNSPSGTFLVGPGQSQEVIVTVERGPNAFTYENLSMYAIADCEGVRYDALNNGDWPPEPFFELIDLDVYFLEPCSPIDIGFPLQNWVLTPGAGNTLFITLNEFNRYDSDLELIRVQYRRKQGDGAWINIVDVPKAQLNNDVFKIVQWDTQGLKDGEYEIRAITQCYGAQNPGISTIISGRLERTPPEIVGTPEPADGVLSSGDEISITFSEPIRCDQLIQADFFSNNNVGLYDTETGSLIDAVVTCSGDKITIVPNVPNKYIENKVLRVQVNNIKDLAANAVVEKKWEFFCDRNPIRWVGGNVDIMKYENEFITLTRKIENAGGQATNFEILGVPDWMHVSPKIGTLPPGSATEITFEFDSSMVFGAFVDTLRLDVVEGVEPLYVSARVICRPPVWEIRPSDFTYSMNMSLQLNIEGSLATDNADIVAAFIDGECRGKAYLQYVPSLNKWEAFLTVYSDDFSGGDINLQIWDASGCLLYGTVAESFTFESDDLEGTPQYPITVHTNNLLLREIPLHNGWNWISFNLEFPDPEVNVALESLRDPQEDYIKGQSSFSTYYGAGFDAWIGSLSSLSNTTMYQYRADVADTIKMLGHPIDVSTTSIPVSAGWNWVGYLPQAALPVNTALASLVPLNGDVIKSQTSFAQYVAGFGWLGNLAYMEAPNGYLLKLSNPGTLTYPDNSVMAPLVAERSAPTSAYWTVDPTAFEHSMTLIGMLSAEGLNVTGPGFELGTFVNGQLRGAAQAIYVAPLNAYLFFLTAYANQSGELLSFRLYDGTTVDNLQESLYFSADAQLGSVEAPQPFTRKTSDTEAAEDHFVSYFEVYPNPFNEQAYFNFTAETVGDAVLTVSDAMGAVQALERLSAHAGLNAFVWDGRSEGGTRLPAGVYFVQLKVGNEILSRKVVIQR